MTLGEKLRELRERKRVRQEDVAKALNISRGTYLYYEKGDRYPKKKETYEKLAEFFGVEFEELWSLREERGRIVVRDPNLTAKEKRDIKDLKGIMTELRFSAAGGLVEDEEDLAKIMESVEEIFWDAKTKASEKFTPNKYKK